MRVIAGDIGGTKTLLQLMEVEGKDLRVVAEQRFESAKYKSFDALLRDFVDSLALRARCACFAVAGPIVETSAHVTNLGWFLSERDLEKSFELRSVTLVNDFHAVAAGIPMLTRDDLVVINDAKPDLDSPIAILGAGTGLGEAFLIPDDPTWRVISSEGGHADFGPRNDDQMQLLTFLYRKYDHVSYERLVSGMGLANIFRFLLQRDFANSPRYRDIELTDEALPPKIAELADGGDPLATRTLEVFVDIYAAEAGNIALKAVARGGVYIAGGIASKHIKRFTDGRFLRSFLDKGRFRSLLESCPVYLIKDTTVGLRGAASIAVAQCAVAPRTAW